MTTRRALFVALVVVLVSASHPARAADLAGAKALYAATSYEEALARLGPPGAVDEAVIEANQLRALCLLALGRTSDAESALERIVRHDPAYAVAAAEVSPKLVAAFREVRRRTLPALVRAAYAAGKTHVDANRWTAARAEFTRLSSLFADPDLAGQRDSGLDDLRLLGQGFLTLIELRLTAERSQVAMAPPGAPLVPASVPLAGGVQETPTATASAAANRPRESALEAPGRDWARVPTASTTPPTLVSATEPATGSAQSRGTAGPESDEPTRADAAETPAASGIFSALHQEVTPPVELLRRMPRWSPSDGTQSRATFQGLLEIVIDERGTVESASIVRSVTPSYDEVLVQAALAWRFGPARKDGKPVRYRRVLEIVLRPTRIN
jgi:TonB family protein